MNQGELAKAIQLHPRHWPSRTAVTLLRGLARLPQPWQPALAAGIGRLACRLLPSRRKVVERNLAICFPGLEPSSRQRLLEAQFTAAGMTLLEMATAWYGDLDPLADRLQVDGLHHLQQAQAQGRGVLLLGGHFLCMEMVGSLFARRWPIDIVYRRQAQPVFDAAEQQGRRRHFAQLIEHHRIWEVARRLRAGHAVWFAADQDAGPRSAVFAPFFGLPAATQSSPARLVRVTGARVLFVRMARREPAPGWTLRFCPPPPGYPSGRQEADAATFNAMIEAAVRAHPAQYLWLHRRFKTRPAGAPALY